MKLELSPLAEYLADHVLLSVAALGARPDPSVLINDLADRRTLWRPPNVTTDWPNYRPTPENRTLILVGKRSVIRLSHPGQMPVETALHALSTRYPYLIEPRLAILCLIGAHCLEAGWSSETCSVVNGLAIQIPFAWKQAPPQTPLLTRGLLEDLIAEHLTPIGCFRNEFALPPLHPIDVARAQLILARALWQSPWNTPDSQNLLSHPILVEPELLTRLDPAYVDRYDRLAATAGLGLALRGESWVTIAGERLQLRGDHELAYSWGTVLTFVALGPIPTASLIGQLVPDRLLPIPLEWWSSVETDADPVVLQGLALSLVRDAQTFAAFAPEGVFDVLLPEGLGLRAFGLQGLRLVVTKTDMWYRPLAPEPIGQIGHWTPEFGEVGRGASTDDIAWNRRWQGFRAWMDVVCAAVWHDLHVAGEASFRASAKRPHQRGRRESLPPTPQPAPQADVVVLNLPRPLRLAGRREWGSPQERESIQKRLHGVAGHLRRLPGNWQRSPDAEEMARDYGVVLPQGYTFVRPFVRGSDGDKSGLSPRVVIRSRGLASLLSFGGRPVRHPRPNRDSQPE